MENEDGDGVEVHQESLSSSSSSSLSSSPSSSPSHPPSSSSSPSTPKQHSIQSSSASSPSSSVLFSGASSPAHRMVDEDGVEAEGTLHHDSRFDAGASSSAQQDFSTESNQDYNNSSQVLEETGSHSGNINAEEPSTSGGTELTSAMLDTYPVNDRSQHSMSGLESKTDDITVEKFGCSEGELHTSVQLSEPATSTASKGTQENAIEDHSKETSAMMFGLNGSSMLPSSEPGSNYKEAITDVALMDGSYQHLRSKDNFQLNDVPGNASQAVCDHERRNSQLRPVPVEPQGLSRGKEDLSQEEPALSDQGPLDDSEIVQKGLQRAQTMPNGSFKDDDVAGSAKRRPSFRRSSTDKSKGSEKDNARTPGAKLSKRQQKKLMKRLCTVKRDGTVEFDVDGSTHLAQDIFGTDTGEEFAFEGEEDGEKTIQPLQIAMLIVGTRGDVQPFVAIGKHLQEYGHRVRLATHSNFREFVLKAGLEFFPLGGDPKVLAGYMVKNKGFLPSGPSEIRTQRKQLKSIINSLLPACKDPDKTGVPFKAQAIIANPPAYGHVHVAEYLKVPLHIFFTMPWTPTSEFPHPLSRVHHFAANRLSYQVVDSLIWWGIRGIINDFRKKKLKLRPITYLSGSQLSVSKLPTGYIWSPHLVPKPKDWGPKVDVVGFCFLNLSQDYEPPEKLVRWLAAGPAPIYVGFGSLPVEDPQGMTKIILEALAQTSQRGIIDKGWGGIGNMENLPASVYLLDNCPHDWLFPQCTAVVHHGGAGTTAAGLKAACPTTIVPFFGDQPFWGDRVHARGVGPSPIPVGEFSLDKLVNAIKFMLEPQVKEKAIELAEAMKEENGVVGAVKAFHKHLPSVMPESTPQMPDKSFYERIVNHKLRSCFGGGHA